MLPELDFDHLLYTDPGEHVIPAGWDLELLDRDMYLVCATCPHIKR